MPSTGGGGISRDQHVIGKRSSVRPKWFRADPVLIPPRRIIAYQRYEFEGNYPPRMQAMGAPVCWSIWRPTHRVDDVTIMQVRKVFFVPQQY
ncbi:hypothetical protein LSAT2_016072 [Lamellibrachia satsuma]|nr:hypothetical protein LSAT2_016072 [Lamellibrachia satsuma]